MVMEALLVQRHPSCTPGAGVWTVRSIKVGLDVKNGLVASIPPSSVLS